jgi:hypothetical protein
VTPFGSTVPQATLTAFGQYKVEIQTSLGTIRVALFADMAQQQLVGYAGNANSGRYDGGRLVASDLGKSGYWLTGKSNHALFGLLDTAPDFTLTNSFLLFTRRNWKPNPEPFVAGKVVEGDNVARSIQQTGEARILTMRIVPNPG